MTQCSSEAQQETIRTSIKNNERNLEGTGRNASLLPKGTDEYSNIKQKQWFRYLGCVLKKWMECETLKSESALG